ncbi:Non-reducing polyketide synthase cla3 [Colletotrichum higginsianum]|nr:Non-reducing polyketide synthase cla3 [Colletotrichum higginsianum]
MVGIVRAAKLIQFCEVNPQLLHTRSSLVGACGGLLVASTLMISQDVQELYRRNLELIRITTRLGCMLTTRSRAVEDVSDSWGWSFIGPGADQLQGYIDSFHDSKRIPAHKKIKIGASDVDDGWHTVIGPPSVLKQFTTFHTVKSLPKRKLRISSLTHVLDEISHDELDYILGNAAVLGVPVVSKSQMISLGSSTKFDGQTWRDILTVTLREICTVPLKLRQGLATLVGQLPTSSTTDVYVIAPTAHLTTVANFLEQSGKSLNVLQEATAEHEEEKKTKLSGNIAIVGMGGRFPACDDLEGLWDIISEGQIVHSEVPRDRFNVDELYDPKTKLHLSTSTKYGCFIRQPGLFDARFFQVSPREALQMDPAHRLFLMSTYEALEMAGYGRGRFASPHDTRIATFFGQASEDWRDIMHISGGDAYSLTGLQRSFGPGRVNYSMRWSGPTYSVDSACASSLSSVNLACSSLLARDCDMAVAGAANLITSPVAYHMLDKAGFLSKTGGCKVYRSDADGYCRGEFVGAFVLKRLEDAIADNDNILSVIASSARNHSGTATSITRSDHRAQELLMAETLRKACLEPRDISYVEMHGTGTQVGDVAEMTAVANVFGNASRSVPLSVGTIKANIGHSEAGSGAAALVKSIMMLQANIIPPQAGLPHDLNPKFPDLNALKIRIPTTQEPLVPGTSTAQTSPNSILINSFDASGGNTSIVLRGPPQEAAVHHQPDQRQSQVVVTSARTAGAHVENKRRLLAYLKAYPGTSLADLAYTTTARRLHHPIRAAFAVETIAQLVYELEEDLRENKTIDPSQGASSSSSSTGRISFVFTGQGALYGGMGSDLYETAPVFRDKVNLCDRLAKSMGFPPFLDLIVDRGSKPSTKTTAQTQLAIVTVQVSLAAFWAACGIKPAMVMGHSLGEYCALHVAGVLSLSDMLFLVGQRATLIQDRLVSGAYAMLSVGASEKTLSQIISARPRSSCQIACVNSPSATVVSGLETDIKELQQHIHFHNLRSTMLPMAYGFHSAQLDPILLEYENIAKGVRFSAPEIPVASTLLGQVVSFGEAFNAAYLARQAREPVNFLGAFQGASTNQKELWMELGPSSVCVDLLRASAPADTSSTFAPSLQAGVDCWTTISRALAAAYRNNTDIDWANFHQPFIKSLRLLALPGYAFDTSNYWRTYQPPKAASSPDQDAAPAQVFSTTIQRIVSESYDSGAQATFETSLHEPKLLPVISGHRLQGLAISPGAVFGDMAFSAAGYLLARSGRTRTPVNTSRLSMRKCVYLRPLALQEGNKEQKVTLSAVIPAKDSAGGVVSVKLCSSNEKPAVEYARCSIIEADHEAVAQEWQTDGPAIRDRCAEVIQVAKNGHGHRLSSSLFYALFSHTVSYSDVYRRVTAVSVSESFDEAVADVELLPSAEGANFTMNPYWIDSVVHVAGFLANCNPTKANNVVALLHSLASWDTLESFEPNKHYRVYVRANKPAAGGSLVDVWVMHNNNNNNNNNLVMMCKGLRFQETPISVLTGMINSPLSEGESAASVSMPVAAAKKASGLLGSAMGLISPTEKPIAPKDPLRIPHTTLGLAEAKTSEEKLSQDRLLAVLLTVIAENTGYEVASLSTETALPDLGVDSIMAVQIAMRLQDILGIEVEAAPFYEHSTIGSIMQAIGGLLSASSHDEQCNPPKGVATTVQSLPPAPPGQIVEDPMANGHTDVFDAIIEALSHEVGVESSELSDGVALADLGVDSIMAVQIAMAIQETTGFELGATSFHEYPTIGDLRSAFTGVNITSAPDNSIPSIENPKTPWSFHNATPSENYTTESSFLQPTESLPSNWSSNSSLAIAVDSHTVLPQTLSPDKPHLTERPVENKTPVIPDFIATRPHTPLGRTSRVSAERSSAAAAVSRTVAAVRDSTPRSHVVLMHGQLSSKLTPLFMFPDGTGGAATYIYMKRLSDNRPVYAVESPFLHCPERFTCGTEDTAAMMAEAVLRTRPHGPYLLAGYSGGAILAYETARQLLLSGHQVQGLLLYDMAAPKIRPDPNPDALPKVLVEMMVRLMGGSRNKWLDQAVAERAQLHMRNTVRCVSTYDAKPMPFDKRPVRSVVTWCKLGVAERLDEGFKRTLASHGVWCEEVPNFMEDPSVGPFNWTFPANKPLGPNGWDKMVGPVHCMAVDADHFSLMVPPDVTKFQNALEEGIRYCVT